MRDLVVTNVDRLRQPMEQIADYMRRVAHEREGGKVVPIRAEHA